MKCASATVLSTIERLLARLQSAVRAGDREGVARACRRLRAYLQMIGWMGVER